MPDSTDHSPEPFRADINPVDREDPAVHRQPNQSVTPSSVPADPVRPVVAHDRPVEAKKVEPPIVAPPLSMKPDEYASKLTEQRERAFAEKEKTLTEKHKNEVEMLNHRHEGEKKLLADQREASKKEVDAIKEYVAMWQRQSDDLQRGGHEGSVRRHDLEAIEIARKTGYEVRQPPGGDRIITGFPEPLVKGQPWVRPIGSFDGSRLHPSL